MKKLLAFFFVILAAGAAWAEDMKPLMAPEEVMALGPDALLIDMRGEAGEVAHPPGAAAAPYHRWRGPKSNPGEVLSDGALTALLQRIGASPDRPTVVLWEGRDATGFGGAARVYWTLKSAGLTRIAILNGGIAAWRAAGGPMTMNAPRIAPSDHVFTLSDEWRATRAEVEAISKGVADGALVDARPDAFLKGKKKHPAARRAGTLNGAVNLEHASWFRGGAGRGLLDRFRDPGRDGPIVSFCNTGHWAATNWFMMSEVEGVEGVKLYPESMVGWTLAGGETVLR